MHLKDGSCLGDAWDSSYVAGYPNGQDLCVSKQVEPTTDGRFLLTDDGQPRRPVKSMDVVYEVVV